MDRSPLLLIQKINKVAMEMNDIKQRIDEWITQYGVRYFDIRTNTLLLMEEMGEFARLVARIYGEQSFKKETEPANTLEALEDEWADILFVMICIANQTGMNIDSAIEKNLLKKTGRDVDRHLNNNKLTSE